MNPDEMMPQAVGQLPGEVFEVDTARRVEVEQLVAAFSKTHACKVMMQEGFGDEDEEDDFGFPATWMVSVSNSEPCCRYLGNICDLGIVAIGGLPLIVAGRTLDDARELMACIDQHWSLTVLRHEGDKIDPRKFLDRPDHFPFS